MWENDRPSNEPTPYTNSTDQSYGTHVLTNTKMRLNINENRFYNGKTTKEARKEHLSHIRQVLNCEMRGKFLGPADFQEYATIIFGETVIILWQCSFWRNYQE